MAWVNGSRPLTGRNVFWGLVAGFGIVVAVNAVLVWLALGSWPGLVSQTSYQDGLAYNQVLADGQRQDAMGWQVAVAAEAGELEATFEDDSGDPIAGLMLAGTLLRPTHEGDDVVLDWRERVPGAYVAKLDGVAPGNWNLVIETARSGEPYRL